MRLAFPGAWARLVRVRSLRSVSFKPFLQLPRFCFPERGFPVPEDSLLNTVPDSIPDSIPRALRPVLRPLWHPAAWLGLAAVLTAPAVLAQQPAARQPVAASAPAAVAKLTPTAGSEASGAIRFAAAGDGVARVSGEVRGLEPNSTHGFHIHEKGDCSAPDAMSAGGHFNPGKQPHGDPAGNSHHAGDLPNLVADANGVARVSLEHAHVALSGPDSIVGRALIVHRDPDDYLTQPTGNSGARLACAVITAGPLQSAQ